MLKNLPLALTALPGLATGYVVAFVLGRDYYAAWLATLTVWTFLTYGWDKLAAIRKWWRTPEGTLHALAVAGGFIGATLGRTIFRHKTQKPIFTVIIIVAALVQAAIAWMIYFQ